MIALFIVVLSVFLSVIIMNSLVRVQKYTFFRNSEKFFPLIWIIFFITEEAEENRTNGKRIRIISLIAFSDYRHDSTKLIQASFALAAPIIRRETRTRMTRI